MPAEKGCAVHMDSLERGQVRFRVHGPDTATDEVSAGVFSRQLGTLFRALKAADKAANGRPIHDYVIANLSTTTPTALLAERPLPKFKGQFITGHSGIAAFEDCVNAITIGAQERALSYGTCVNQIARFVDVGYSEIWTSEAKVFRVDHFLKERAHSIIASDSDLARFDRLPEMISERDWYKGVASGSFDGEIKAADLRGALPQLALVLTAGGNEIECICREEDIESIRAALNRRARVYGRAIYDGRAGLPRRIEVSKIELVAGSRDFTRWKGAFKPFNIEAWEEDES